MAAAVSCVSVNVATAQSRLLKGTVSDSYGPMGGVTIVIKGTNTGTAADDNGNFSIEIPEGGAVLIFKSFGNPDKEVKVAANQTELNVLVDDADSKDVGGTTIYGKKLDNRTNTGALSQITAKELSRRPVTNIASALAGAATGVTTTTGSGQPGSSPDIMLRGLGSLSASTAPLIILDGAPYAGSMSNINIQDVETMDILKDAASKAVYGSRAANGVILITTKRGKSAEGKPRIQVDASVGALRRLGQEYKRITDPKRYYEMAWIGYANMMADAQQPPDVEDFIGDGLLGGYNAYNVPNSQVIDMATGKVNPNATLLYNDDWLKELARTGIRQNYNLSVSNGNEKSDYYMSVGYTRDQGIVKFSDYNRITALLSTNTQVTDWLKSGLKVQGNRDYRLFFLGGNSSYINPFFTARDMGAIYPVYRYGANGQKIIDADGNPEYDYGYNFDGNNPGNNARQIRPFATNMSPLAELERNRPYSQGYNANVVGYLEAKFLKDFTAKTQLSYDLFSRQETNFFNSETGNFASQGGLASLGQTTSNVYTFNQFVTWDPSFGIFKRNEDKGKMDKHDLAITVGHEAYNITTRSFSLSRAGFAVPNSYEALSMAAVQQGSDDGTDRLSIETYFSQLQYTYKGKYYVSGTYSRNGSSRFSASQRWGNFGSAGAGWRISDEDFAKEYKWLNSLKVRGSWGVTGNDAINNYYAYLQRYAIRHNNNQPGLVFANFASPKLRWEGLVDANVGFDFAVLDRRLSGTFDVYNRGSNQLLFITPLAQSTGSTGFYDNVGAMRNRGVELQLNADVLRAKDFNWNVRLNAFHNKNQIIEVQGKDSLVDGSLVFIKGLPAYTFYLYEYAGVSGTGKPTWYKKDKSITDNYRDLDPEDKKVFGSSNRWLEGSFTSTVSYKRLDFSFMFQFGLGGKFYDQNYASLMGAGSDRVGNAMHEDLLNSWLKPGDENNANVEPVFNYGVAGNYNGAISNKFLISNSFLNFKNLYLGYTLSPKALENIGFKGVKIYATAENIFQLSARQGVDPNTSFIGVNSYSYFPARTFMLGVNLGLQ